MANPRAIKGAPKCRFCKSLHYGVCNQDVTTFGEYVTKHYAINEQPRINEQTEPIKRTRGRPRKWKDDAERMRAKRAK